MHSFDGDWALASDPLRKYVLPIFPNIIDYVKIHKIQPQTVNFNQVSHKRFVDTESIRYQQANTKYPMLISPMYNPDDLEYRMIDGCHRIYKLKNLGHECGSFYIIPSSIVLLHLRMITP
jgi:hypothetical protein